MREFESIPRYLQNWLLATDLMAPLFSTCSRRQFFAVVLSPNKRVAGIGYNGGPPGFTHCNDGGCPHADDQHKSGTTYDSCIAQHAEAGALLWSDNGLRQNGTVVVNGAPCFGCAKLIASCGIKQVVFWADNGYDDYLKTELFLVKSGVAPIAVSRPISQDA